MKLPIASKYILSHVDDYYLCCFCNSFSTTIKYRHINDLDDFYYDKCQDCIYLKNEECEGGSVVLEDGLCNEFNINEFAEELFIRVHIPNHVYIEKYAKHGYAKSYLMILNEGVLEPLRFPNVHADGEICFGNAFTKSPALRYSNYWNSEFNTDLIADSLKEDIYELEDYLINWSIEKQNDYYSIKSYPLNHFINEDNYIESDKATDIIFTRCATTYKDYIGLGTDNNKVLHIKYL